MAMRNKGIFLAAERRVNSAEVKGSMENLLRSCSSRDDFLQKCRKTLDLNPNDLLEVAWGKKLRRAKLTLLGFTNFIEAKCDLR